MDAVMIIEGVISSGIFAMVIKYYRTHKASHEKLERANLRQIKRDIVCIYRQAMKDGSIAMYELEIFNDLCDSYFELGGNSFVEKISDEVNKLPVRT